MDNKEAIKIAKAYVLDVFADESISDVGLEEITRDQPGIWEVTIGFSRKWQIDKSLAAQLNRMSARRSYKTIRIDAADGNVISMEEAEWAKS